MEIQRKEKAMRTFEEIKDTIETGLGKHPCDLKLQNVFMNSVSFHIFILNYIMFDGLLYILR